MTVEFDSAVNKCQEAMSEGLRAFATWFDTNWKVSREQWLKDNDGVLPDGGYIDGFNAGIDSVQGALDAFMEEFYP